MSGSHPKHTGRNTGAGSFVHGNKNSKTLDAKCRTKWLGERAFFSRLLCGASLEHSIGSAFLEHPENFGLGVLCSIRDEIIRVADLLFF